ncbi:hypothetical protein Agub_g8191 [Astrephomene gubernaculifera]|uniref:Uncharacterized protein n=1 Tax=Astrephomene gubernaculifera TaxID=47775 RepID=A0AAD3DRA6_9CHLO|nr:hypothetical protein Agub_g8191 [Astrephomene gubernaculifera]
MDRSGSANTGAKPRKELNWWHSFNSWWRDEYDRLGRRPRMQEVDDWYRENAERIWGAEKPSLEATRDHAKCLRSKKELREYFQRYNARKGRSNKKQCSEGFSPGSASDPGFGSGDLDTGGGGGGTSGLATAQQPTIASTPASALTHPLHDCSGMGGGGGGRSYYSEGTALPVPVSGSGGDVLLALQALSQVLGGTHPSMTAPAGCISGPLQQQQQQHALQQPAHAGLLPAGGLQSQQQQTAAPQQLLQRRDSLGRTLTPDTLSAANDDSPSILAAAAGAAAAAADPLGTGCCTSAGHPTRDTAPPATTFTASCSMPGVAIRSSGLGGGAPRQSLSHSHSQVNRTSLSGAVTATMARSSAAPVTAEEEDGVAGGRHAMPPPPRAVSETLGSADGSCLGNRSLVTRWLAGLASTALGKGAQGVGPGPGFGFDMADGSGCEAGDRFMQETSAGAGGAVAGQSQPSGAANGVGFRSHAGALAEGSSPASAVQHARAAGAGAPPSAAQVPRLVQLQRDTSRGTAATQEQRLATAAASEPQRSDGDISDGGDTMDDPPELRYSPGALVGDDDPHHDDARRQGCCSNGITFPAADGRGRVADPAAPGGERFRQQHRNTLTHATALSDPTHLRAHAPRLPHAAAAAAAGGNAGGCGRHGSSSGPAPLSFSLPHRAGTHTHLVCEAMTPGSADGNHSSGSRRSAASMGQLHGALQQGQGPSPLSGSPMPCSPSAGRAPKLLRLDEVLAAGRLGLAQRLFGGEGAGGRPSGGGGTGAGAAPPPSGPGMMMPQVGGALPLGPPPEPFRMVPLARQRSLDSPMQGGGGAGASGMLASPPLLPWKESQELRQPPPPLLVPRESVGTANHPVLQGRDSLDPRMMPPPPLSHHQPLWLPERSSAVRSFPIPAQLTAAAAASPPPPLLPERSSAVRSIPVPPPATTEAAAAAALPPAPLSALATHQSYTSGLEAMAEAAEMMTDVGEPEPHPSPSPTSSAEAHLENHADMDAAEDVEDDRLAGGNNCGSGMEANAGTRPVLGAAVGAPGLGSALAAAAAVPAAVASAASTRLPASAMAIALPAAEDDMQAAMPPPLPPPFRSLAPTTTGPAGLPIVVHPPQMEPGVLRRTVNGQVVETPVQLVTVQVTLSPAAVQALRAVSCTRAGDE